MSNIVKAVTCGSLTRGLEEFDSTATVGSGAISIDSAVTIINNRSLKLAIPSSSEARVRLNDVLADAGRRLAICYKTDALPVAGVNHRLQLLGVIDSGGTNEMFEVAVNPSGQIAIYGTSSGTLVASGTTDIATNTNYIIAVSYVVTSGSNFTIKVWVGTPQANNLTLVLTVTNADFSMATVGGTRLQIGGDNTASSGTCNQYFDALVIDDGTDLAVIGDVACTPKLVSADSSINFDTAIGSDPGAGSRYQVLDDRPVDITTGRQQAASTQASEDFTVQASNVGDVDISAKTVVGCGVFAYTKRQTAGFVNFIGESQTKGNGTTEVMSGAEITNGVVSTGDTVFVSFHGDTGMTTTPTIAHVGSSITWTTEEDANNSGNVRTMLFRGEVTAGGTITSITVSWTTNIAARVMQAARYRFVGATSATSAQVTGNGSVTALDMLSVPAFGLYVAACGIEDNTAPTAPNHNVVDSGINTTGSGANSNIGGLQAYELNAAAAAANKSIGFSHATLDRAAVGRVYDPLDGAGTEKLRIDASDLSLALTGLNAPHTAWRTSSTYPSTVGLKSTGNAADTYLYELAAIVVYTSASAPAAWIPARHRRVGDGNLARLRR